MVYNYNRFDTVVYFCND